MTEGVFHERVDLPSGGWVDLRPATAVPERLRRPVKRAAIKATQDNPTVRPGDRVPLATAGALFDAWDEITDLIMVAFIAKWSFSDAVDLEGVRNLPGADYDVIAKAVGSSWDDLLPDFGAPEDVTDPKV